MKRVAIAIVLTSATLAAGCRDLEQERCEEICMCEACDETAQTECELDVEAALDVAAAYGCDDQADRYLECELENFRCFDDVYQLPGGVCNEQLDKLASCQDAASKRTGGAYPPPSF